jgi:hypothetical protein
LPEQPGKPTALLIKPQAWPTLSQACGSNVSVMNRGKSTLYSWLGKGNRYLFLYTRFRVLFRFEHLRLGTGLGFWIATAANLNHNHETEQNPYSQKSAHEE